MTGATDGRPPLAKAAGEHFGSRTESPPKFSGTITDLEIEAAERALGVKFPNSYRLFLRRCGDWELPDCQVFGIPFGHIRGDVVLANQLTKSSSPERRFLKIAQRKTGQCFYLDTSARNGACECPVVHFDDTGRTRIAAANFFDFLLSIIADLR